MKLQYRGMKTQQEIEIDEVPPTFDRYAQSGELKHLHSFFDPNHKSDTQSSMKRGEDSHRPRLLSEFIRKMTEDKLLVPERCIHLRDIVGQGEGTGL